ncbi:cation:proton antiporter [Faecalibacterium sp. Marseille-Q3530]|uniref:cation:proton antiporter n=1 Tax=Faecalibacterium sp. Marseille-Q3530 TaxID=2758403 RepID=UPI001A9AB613|nr:cation:proton antiporter [Faecalibacterium sp. Marseille-Q3530]MBO1288583.1 cation:proton antiporter [Faecalibacterium sp. Marseille-Q3530]
MYSVFRNLAIIILTAKFFGLVARKCKAPQVVGEIIAGLLIGPCVLNLVHISDTISVFAEIGVVLLMFSTGLGTNLKELIKAGPIATLIACVGVAVPLAGGTLLYSIFYGFAAVGSTEFYKALFIGTIMTATSVSITVAALQEMGHLKSFLGTTIVSAAVIDDVIGIVVLTCVLGAGSGTGTGLGKVLFNTVLFFATAIGVGLIAHFAMKWLDKRNPHTQRITIVSMAFCFAMAYVAEEYFGIADITGAYIAGIVFCSMDDASYVERRVDISNYVLFAPVFFASIGLKTDISGLTPQILLFSVCFVIMALITKVIGCGLAAKICRFSWADSLKVGVGMMTRGEVALIVAQKGLDIGVVDPVYFTAVILLIVVSSVATPLVLKVLFTKAPPTPHPSQSEA